SVPIMLPEIRLSPAVLARRIPYNKLAETALDVTWFAFVLLRMMPTLEFGIGTLPLGPPTPMKLEPMRLPSWPAPVPETKRPLARFLEMVFRPAADAPPTVMLLDWFMKIPLAALPRPRAAPSWSVPIWLPAIRIFLDCRRSIPLARSPET